MQNDTEPVEAQSDGARRLCKAEKILERTYGSNKWCSDNTSFRFNFQSCLESILRRQRRINALMDMQGSVRDAASYSWSSSKGRERGSSSSFTWFRVLIVMWSCLVLWMKYKHDWFMILLYIVFAFRTCGPFVMHCRFTIGRTNRFMNFQLKLNNELLMHLWEAHQECTEVQQKCTWMEAFYYFQSWLVYVQVLYLSMALLERRFYLTTVLTGVRGLFLRKVSTRVQVLYLRKAENLTSYT